MLVWAQFGAWVIKLGGYRFLFFWVIYGLLALLISFVLGKGGGAVFNKAFYVLSTWVYLYWSDGSIHGAVCGVGGGSNLSPECELFSAKCTLRSSVYFWFNNRCVSSGYLGSVVLCLLCACVNISVLRASMHGDRSDQPSAVLKRFVQYFILCLK